MQISLLLTLLHTVLFWRQQELLRCYAPYDYVSYVDQDSSKYYNYFQGRSQINVSVNVYKVTRQLVQYCLAIRVYGKPWLAFTNYRSMYGWTPQCE